MLHSTEDHAELRRCELRERQYLITCTIQDLQQPAANLLSPQLLPASPHLLQGLQAELACASAELERDQLSPSQGDEP